MNNKLSIKYDSNIDNEIKDYLNPDYIYIPVNNGDKVLIKTNDYVYKDEEIIDGINGYEYSPISGNVIGMTYNMQLHNKKIKCLVIKNDYKEKVKKRYSAVRYISKYSKNELLELISKYHASKADFNANYKILLINGMDKDPYEHTRSFLINNNSDKLLETIDALNTILGVNCILAINNNDTNNVINLTNNIGTYPNIKLRLMPDIYPISFSRLLAKNALSKKQLKMGVLVVNIEDIYNIYIVLKRRKPITEKLVTISGDVIEFPFVCNVKIGTSMADLIKNTCNVLDDKYYVVVNGLISGLTISNLNSVILNNTRSIFLNTKDKSRESECINCGLCNLKCPMKLNPKYLREHKKADRSKCIHCGLCTYICPAKINFKECLGVNDEK